MIFKNSVIEMMVKSFVVLVAVLGSMSLRAQTPPVCDVRAYGAKGDGEASDTAAMTNAIAACSKQGGGTVYLSAGHYRIGTVQLQSHIHLLLDSGAVLVGSHEIGDYLPSPPFGFARHYGFDITGEGTVLGMLIAKDATDIAIDGQGEIDGQGDTFVGMQVSHGGNDYDPASVRNPDAFQTAMATVDYGPVEPVNRPGTMLVFFHCSNIRIRGITLRNAPNWTMHFQDVDGGAVTGFQILNNPKIPNNDGFDCMQCRHVRIADCHIDAGDDDLAIVMSEQISVSNCSMESRSAAIRLESTRLSTFTGLSMNTNRGIAVFANGYPGQENRPTENVTFSDIVIRTHLIPGGWWGKAEPVYIAVQPCTPLVKCEVRVRNVVFNDVTAEAESGVLLWGGDGTPIAGVEFNGLRLHMLPPPADLANSVGGNLDLRWTATSPKFGIVASDIPAFYAKYVEGLRMRDVQVDWAPAMPGYFSDALRVEQFKDLIVDGFSGRQAQAERGAAIALENGTGVAITQSRALPGTRTFLQMDHVGERRVFVNYDLGGAATVMTPANQRFETQIDPRAVKAANR